MKNQSLIKHLNFAICLLMLLLIIFQTTILIKDYAYSALRHTVKTIGLTSMERNAQFYCGKDCLDYFALISSVVPSDQIIVIPSGNAYFYSQSPLQFFLMPRKIYVCSCSEFYTEGIISDECKSCISREGVSILSVANFPPDTITLPGKKFVPFASGEKVYKGIYVPEEIDSTNAPPFISMETPLFIAIILDLIVIILIIVLGSFFARIIDHSLGFLDLVSLSVPLGIGLVSWIVFILSWLGIPTTLPLFLIVIILLLILLFVLGRKHLFIKKSDFSSEFNSFKTTLSVLIKKPVAIITMLLLLFISSLLIVLSIGRGYSQYDDIVNWGLKGYGIALENSIFAGQTWGGHGLSYPQNIPLFISFFRLLDGDVLPGSKIVYSLFTFSFLFGLYSFLKNSHIKSEFSLLACLLLITTPFAFLHSTLGWGNLIFSIYLVMAVFYLVRGYEAKQSQKNVIGGILLGLATWTRPEGIGYALVITLLFLLANVIGRKNKPIVWVIPVILIGVTWLLFSTNSIKNDEIGDVLSSFFNAIKNGNFNFHQLRLLLSYASSHFSNFSVWGILAVGTFLSLLILLCLKIFWRYDSLILLFVSGLVYLLIPLFMFFVASFDKSNMESFLEFSFDRAQFQGVFLCFVTVIIGFSKIASFLSNTEERIGSSKVTPENIN